MSILKYRAFVEAAASGSLTTAANALNYTQPGISHMISSLENEYGFPLFYRSKQGVTLTEQGRRLYELCQQLLQVEEEISNTVSQFNGAVTGRIRIGSYLSTMTAWIPDAAALLAKRYPQLEMSLIGCEPDDQVALLKNNVIDIGVGSSVVPPGCDFIPLIVDPAVVVLPHGHELLQKDVIMPSDILSYPLILQNDRGAEELRNVFGAQYASLKKKYTVKFDPALICLVARGMGIGVTSQLLVNSTYDVEVRFFDKPYARTMGLVIPKWKPITPAVQCFIQVMCELYQEEQFSYPVFKRHVKHVQAGTGHFPK